MARLESFMEPELMTSHKDGLHKGTALVQARQKVPIQIENVSDQHEVQAGGISLGRCEPVVWASPTDDLEPQPERTRGLCEQLQRVVSCARPNLKSREAHGLEEFITEFQDVFATKSDDCGRTDTVHHPIDNEDARAICQLPRKLPLAKQADVNGTLKNMEERAVIKESDSPWSSPVVLVCKNGDLRFCVDSRKLNDVIKKDCFPVPRIDDTLDTLAGAK
jgi:hypothetical protein